MDIIDIEVAYATAKNQLILTISIPQNTTILEAIKISNIISHFNELQDIIFNENTSIGIFGKKVNITNYQLQGNDRIEIYRPLSKTPNQRRLERAKQ